MIGDPAVTFIFYYDQTPACNLQYSSTYTVNGTANPAFPWLSISTSGILNYPTLTISTSDVTVAGT